MLLRSLLLIVFLLPALARAYWDEAWGFRTTVTVTETSGTTLTDYQVLLSISASDLHSQYDWSTDGRDLRILDGDDSSQLDYWIDSWDSSAQTAEIWVRFDSLTASADRTIYLYYGNDNAGAVTQAPPVFTYEGIKFHTRYNTVDVSSKAQAFSIFNAGNDNQSGYGCTFIDNFTGITNKSTFTNGSSTNFIAYSQSYFYVDTAGTWYLRYGADFGYGGGLYVDGVALEEQWNDDIWWAGSWPRRNSADILYGSISLSVGYHKLEIIGGEPGNDGGITAQFCKPGGNCTANNTNRQRWQAFSTANIDIRSYSCPISEPLVSFGAHETRAIDLALSASAPDMWVVGATRDLTLSLLNNGPAAASSGTALSVTLGSQLVVDSVTGSGWSCSGSAGSFSCSYSGVIASGSSFPALILAVRAQSNSVSSASYSADVVTSQYETNTANNSVSGTLTVRSLTLPAGTGCSSPDGGLWARFFDTTTSSVDYPDNATEYQQMVDTFANETYLDGQTLRDNVNGSGNPFDDRADEYYLTLMEGYLYIPSDGDWGLAVNGDDAIEILLNGVVSVSWYGGHGAATGATNGVTLGLARGYHRFEFRHQEFEGGDSYTAYWRQGTSGSYSIIPASNFVQCDGVFDLQLTPSLTIISDPINGTSSPKAIPGAVLEYSVLAENQGSLNSDTDTTVVTQAVADSADFYIGDGSSSPVSFTDGSGVQSSGVTFSYPGGLTLSCDNGATFTCAPTADGDGYTAGVTHFRLSLEGSMMPQLGTLQPQFTYQYRVRLK